MSEEIMRLPAVKAATGLAKSSIYRLVAAGDLPAPVRLTKRAVGWKRREVESWLAERNRTRSA